MNEFFLIKTANAATVFSRMRAVGEGNYNVDEKSPVSIFGSVVSVGLGILGVIFVALVISAGYKWMMAGGDSKKIDESKDTLWRAVIGLIITVSAYAIKVYVFESL